MKKTTLYLFLCAVLAMTAMSCNTEAPDSTTPFPSSTVYDFATLAATNADGSTFTLCKPDESTLITYTCSTSLASQKNIKVGDRLIIAYTTTTGLQPYQSGPITLLGYVLLNNKTQTLEELSGEWTSNPVEMQVMTRTGNYINMQMQLYAQSANIDCTLQLVGDPTTYDSEYPQLYFIYDTKTFGDNKFLAYTSYDISEVWNRDTCKGVKVTFQNTGSIKSFTFQKDGKEVPKPNE